MDSLQRIELRHIRAFTLAAEELHFGRAADHLHISQPSLSRIIRSLEEHLRVQLFCRTTNHRVALTSAGTAYLEQAYLLLAQCEEAAQIAQRIGRGENKQLNVGFTVTALLSILIRVVKACDEYSPRIPISLRDLPVRSQIQALQKGRIDVGFAVAPTRELGIAYEHILTCPMIVALPEDHPCALLPCVPLQSLAEDRWVWFSREANPAYHDYNLSQCQQAGFQPRIEHVTNQPYILATMVANGLGVALMTQWTEGLYVPGVIYRPLEPTWTIDLQLMWREKERSSLVHTFLDLVRTINSNP